MGQSSDFDLKKNLIKNNSGQALLFFVIFAVFIITLAASFGLYLLNNAQNNALKTLQDQVTQKEDQISSDADQIFALDAKFKTLKQVLSQHIHDSNVFQFIESNTHPQVSFSNFQLSQGTAEVNLEGSAPSYTVLAQQVLIFEHDPNVQKVDFGGLSLGSNNVLKFKLTITLNPKIFIRQTSASVNTSTSTPTQ